MKRIFSFLLMIACLTAHSQNADHIAYYYQGKKISFPLNYERLLIKISPAETPASRRQQITSIFNLPDASLKQTGDKSLLAAKLPAGTTIASVKERIANLRKQGFSGVVRPAFKSPSGKDMGYGEDLVVKLKPGTSITALENLVKKTNCSIIKKYAFADKVYIIAAGEANNYDALETANVFFETGMFEYAEPDLTLFDAIAAAPNDPLFGYQWSQQNNGSAIQYNGAAGTDMKVQQAWNITRGAGIKVAVIDQGVDLSHPDLQANLLQGYDAISGTANAGDGKPLASTNGHGTACAGIIAAVANNNIGIAGVAPESKIIPINVVAPSGVFAAYTGLAAAFDYAWQNGADVISNSWGGGSPSQLMDDAITRAVTQGRSGKGCVVLFASGNDNSSISYPSTNPSVICVGGVNMCGQRKSPSSCDGETWWGANYGAGLDIVAPCVKIATTDISGTGGYNPSAGTDGNYFATFNGTSSATPNAAGVAALVLSVNNAFTTDQARKTLEASCAKLPGYAYSTAAGQPNGSWNNETGYGALDAYAALQVASTGSSCSVQINGPSYFCPGVTTTLWVANPVAGTTYQWRKDGVNLATGNSINTSTGGSYSVVATQSNGCTAFSTAVVLPEHCQVVMNSNDPASVCGAYFFDSGGSTGNYGNNESFTKTFLPTGPGQLVQITIDSFDIENGDALVFYDGPNTNSQLIAGLTGVSRSSQYFTATTGAITVAFNSNGSGTNRGWFGSVGCHLPSVFRSKKTGLYSDLGTWEMKTATGFINASFLPTYYEDSIIIRNGHTVTIDKSVQLNQLLVESGAVLRVMQDLIVPNGPGDDFVVNGTLEIGNVGVNTVYPDTLKLNGNLVAVTAGGSLLGVVTAGGSTAQTITLGGDATIDQLIITNPAVSINLQGNAGIDQVQVNNKGKTNVNGAFTLLVRVLNLISGRMVIDNAGVLNIKAPTIGAIVGGSESSFIEGPLRRNAGGQGPQTLVFPIGKDVYRPVLLNVTAPTGGSSSYQAQVFSGAPAARVLPASLGAVSNVRYVHITNVGLQPPTAAAVTLSYGTDEGIPYSPASLRIAKDDGAGNWVNLGGQGTANQTGTIVSTENFSSFGDFALATEQPAVPGCTFNTTPANAAILTTTSTAALGWSTVINATSYDVFIWTGATAPTLRTATVTTTTYNATGLTGSTTYNWYVRPKNAAGFISTACADNKTSFTTATGTALPACVINTSPANATTLVTQTSARLVWPAANGATSYDVYFATGNAVPTVLLANVTALSYYAINLIPGTGYSWYVAPRNADGVNASCAATGKTSFTTAVATGGANLAPVANAGTDKTITLPVNQVQLDGGASYDRDGRIAEFYWYQVQGPVNTTISNFSAFPTVQGLTTAGKYIFGLQVKDNNGVTAYATVTVTVNTAAAGVPTCASNAYPVNGTTYSTQNTITLMWGSVANATLYDVYFWTGATAPSAPTASNITATSWLATGLTASTQYKWYVVPRNASGAATGCAANATTFTIDGPATQPACVVNTRPITGSTLVTQTTARLVWPASSSATSYDIYLAAGNTVPVIKLANVAELTYYVTNLTPGTVYNWYIAPRNASGANANCGAANRTSFTTAAATVGGNLAPIANAGINPVISLPATSVILDGGDSYDPDGSIAQYYWYQTQGPVTASLNNFATAPTITGLTAIGTYVFGLQVKDNNGAAAYSSVTITVNAGSTTIPICATNTSPANGSTINTSTSAVLQWGAVANALSYDVYLWTGATAPATAIATVTTNNYNATGLAAATLYNWYVVPKNGAGAPAGCVNVKTSFTTAAAASGTAGTGLLGTYYSGTAPLTGNPLLTRVDPTINMLLTYSTVLSPAPGIVPEDGFSIRWTGQIKADYTETYIFYTLADDGIRLWVNGQLLVDNFVQQGPTERSGTIGLVAGQKYDIKIEYFEYTGESTAKLSWSSASTPKAVVPKINLYPPVSGSGMAASARVNEIASMLAVVNPNPVKRGQEARVKINADKAARVAITLVGSDGHLLSSQKINVLPGINNIPLNTASLAQGLYMIGISGTGKPMSIKLMVIN